MAYWKDNLTYYAVGLIISFHLGIESLITQKSELILKTFFTYFDLQTCSKNFFLHLLHLPENCFVNSKCNFRKCLITYVHVSISFLFLRLLKRLIVIWITLDCWFQIQKNKLSTYRLQITLVFLLYCFPFFGTERGAWKSHNKYWEYNVWKSSEPSILSFRQCSQSHVTSMVFQML